MTLMPLLITNCKVVLLSMQLFPCKFNIILTELMLFKTFLISSILHFKSIFNDVYVRKMQLIKFQLNDITATVQDLKVMQLLTFKAINKILTACHLIKMTNNFGIRHN